MKIIGAGLGKTGTTSLAAALRILGFTVHDFIEQVGYHVDEYLDALDGKMPDFAAMYKDVDATTDNPACLFWKELHECFSEAKVILTERDSVETWVESRVKHAKRMTEKRKEFSFPTAVMYATITGRKFKKLLKMEFQKYQNNEPDKLRSLYLEHNSRVKASIPQDQLLVFNVKQGWKPLCEFLGVDVPDVPFPRLNTKETSGKDLKKIFEESELYRRLWIEFVIVLAAAFVVLGIVVYVMANSMML